MNILGIWDGHDSGAALLAAGGIAAAVNEERFTRRKLEVRFPVNAIQACCESAGIAPAAIDVVACCTSDVAKTLARLAPSTKETYYRLRRRQSPPGLMTGLKKRAKYHITEWPANRFTRAVSLAALRRSLRATAVRAKDVRLFDHHASHAIAAAFGSGFDRCAVMTVDGVGDGLSATVSVFDDGLLTRVAQTAARDSLGVFFEHVTTLLNMRELEDEGKVMALADYASPVADRDNPLLALFEVRGLRLRMTVSSRTLYSRLREVQWRFPNEQFAAMAQRVLERTYVEFAKSVVHHTGCARLALAGGVASNIKANRRIRLLPEVEDVYVFPHMGDGGLALGAALLASAEMGAPHSRLPADLALGPAYSDEELRNSLAERSVSFTSPPDIAAAVADLLASDRIVMWHQGRSEYGPRALGHRSVLARPDRPALRDKLNLVLKRRVWYQPFCPSILESDARRLFVEMKGTPNRHMTTAYQVAEAHRQALSGVINVDGSCRAQVVSDDDHGMFARLLRECRARTGLGALLNTSFNIHGQPLVCTPAQAIEVFIASGADALALGDYLVLQQSPAHALDD